MSRFVEIVSVAAGGAIGCLLRYGAGELIAGLHRISATMTVNITGCLAMGIIAAIMNHFEPSRWLYLFIATGMMGGYTTYSAFALDAVHYIEHGMTVQAAGYIALTLTGAVAGCLTGYIGTLKLIDYLHQI